MVIQRAAILSTDRVHRYWFSDGEQTNSRLFLSRTGLCKFLKKKYGSYRWQPDGEITRRPRGFSHDVHLGRVEWLQLDQVLDFTPD